MLIWIWSTEPIILLSGYSNFLGRRRIGNVAASGLRSVRAGVPPSQNFLICRAPGFVNITIRIVFMSLFTWMSIDTFQVRAER